MSDIAELSRSPQPDGPEAGPRERALVLVPVTRQAAPANGGGRLRETEARVAEAVGLAAAIELDVVGGVAVPLAAFRPATLFGTGKVEEIASRVADETIGLVVVDHPLTPVQQRNLERAWKAKVIDRTGLILEIFGERAQTREGRLQVELAHLNYQKGRLVRSWTHLERQRGGFGFLGGPGETQIEADRRMIEQRVARIEKDLATVATRRRQQRQTRKKAAQPVVALVGYTNAGKSTLFNRLTESAVFADDRLFATLDPTLRRIRLPGGSTTILSDTVGFVADLPTTLVAAFRATLEEVAEADLILHVRDIAHPDSEAQARDVAEVLGELGIDPKAERIVEVWNKIDLIPAGQRPPRSLMGKDNGGGADSPTAVAVSARTGEGTPDLLQAIAQRVRGLPAVYRVTLSGESLGRLHRLYEMGEVIERISSSDGTTTVRLRVRQARLGDFRAAFGEARPVPEGEGAHPVRR